MASLGHLNFDGSSHSLLHQLNPIKQSCQPHSYSVCRSKNVPAANPIKITCSFWPKLDYPGLKRFQKYNTHSAVRNCPKIAVTAKILKLRKNGRTKYRILAENQLRADFFDLVFHCVCENIKIEYLMGIL